VTADGIGYHGGSGEPLVLIHGGGGTWRQWRPVIPLLTQHHEVLAVNLVGHHEGPARPPGSEATLDLLAEGVDGCLDRVGWESAHVAGISLGGLVSLVFARRGRARTCTSIATIGGWDKGGDVALRLVARSYRLFHAVARLMARDPARWSRRPGVRRLLYWHHFARTDRMDPVDTAHMIVGISKATILPELFEWALANDGPTGFDAIPCPVQLLFAERDLVLPRRVHGERLVGAVPQAEVHEIPGAGHCATWDEPGLVAEQILRFTGAA
jgi:pimeloyl-ACP methyl ester carboxylesterase